MTSEKEEVTDDLEWEIMDEDKQIELLTGKVRNKSIHDFLNGYGLSRQKIQNHSMDGMRYITFQMLNEANKTLAEELEEST